MAAEKSTDIPAADALGKGLCELSPKNETTAMAEAVCHEVLQPAIALEEIALSSGSLYDFQVAAVCVGECATWSEDVLVST